MMYMYMYIKMPKVMAPFHREGHNLIGILSVNLLPECAMCMYLTMWNYVHQLPYIHSLLTLRGRAREEQVIYMYMCLFQLN